MAARDKDLILQASKDTLEFMHTWTVRGVGSVRLLVSLAAEHGVAASRCLRGSSISIETLDDPSCEVEASQELTVIRNLLRELAHVAGIGLDAGQRYRLTAWGILGYALLSSRSLRSALEFAVGNLDLTFAFVRFEVTGVADGICITLDDAGVPEDCRQFLVERDAVVAVALCQQLLLKPVPIQRASFRFDRPAYWKRFKQAFPGPVVFGEPAHRIVIAREWADQPLPHADEQALRVCQEQCQEILDRRRVRARMSERVRQYLLRPRRGNQMDEVAAGLGVAPRTLRRQLYTEGTTFRQLVEEVRETLAEEMLAHRMTVGEIAERLGYSERASFVHAFKRWKGLSPTQYRRRSTG